MAKMSMRIKLGDFALHKQNDEGGNDGPCLLTLFAKLDAPLGISASPTSRGLFRSTSPRDWATATSVRTRTR